MMRLRVAKLGAVEWGLIFALLLLIVAETAAFQLGVGPYFTVIFIGCILAIITAYALYRHDKSLAQASAARSDLLRAVDIFRGTTSEERDAVASLGRPVQVPAGQVLGRSGEYGGNLYIILDGQVELSASSNVGEITVRVAGPGESFPLATLIGTGTLITTATAMTDAKLLAIARSDLLALWQDQPRLGMQMYAGVADILGNRYRRTLAHLGTGAEQALKTTDIWANV